jgi:hypothetical protein
MGCWRFAPNLCRIKSRAGQKGNRALADAAKGREGRVFFFVNKKEAKKTLILGACASATPAAQRNQKFFASFFQKRSCFLTLLPTRQVGQTVAVPPPPGPICAMGW